MFTCQICGKEYDDFHHTDIINVDMCGYCLMKHSNAQEVFDDISGGGGG